VVSLARILHEGGRKMMDINCYYNQLQKHNRINPVTVCPCGFMNNILSGIKYRISPEGVSLMDETNNLASHTARISYPGAR